MLLCLVFCTTSASAVEITVEVQNNWPVDIVLCAGDTTKDLEGFEDKLKAELRSAGVDLARVRIQAAESKSFSSTGDGLNLMIKEFTKFPATATNPHISAWGDLIGPSIGGGQPVPFHGMWLKEEGRGSAEVHMMTRLFCPAHALVISPRVRDNLDGTFSGYFCFLRTDAYGGANLAPGVFSGPDTSPTYVDLIKFENQKMDNLSLYLNGISGVEYNRLATSDRVAFQFGYKGSRPPEGIYWGTPISLDVYVKGATFTIYNGANKILEYTDPKPINSGGVLYGMAMAGHGGISEISFSLGAVTPLVDAVRAPNYQSASSRFIVDVCDEPREDFANQEKVGELTQRMLSDNAYYIGWGTSRSKASIDNFVKHNEGQGTYLDNTRTDIYRQTARYIEPIVNKRITNDNEIILEKNREYIFSTKQS